MEIAIKNRLAVVVTVLKGKILMSIVLFLVFLFVGVLMFVPDGTKTYNGIFLVVFVITVPLLYTIWHIFDAVSFCKKTRLTLKENGIDSVSGNLLSNSSISLPFSQISGFNFAQNFWYRLFGIVQINITQEGGSSLTIWGYNKEDVEQFSSEFSKRFKIKIAK